MWKRNASLFYYNIPLIYVRDPYIYDILVYIIYLYLNIVLILCRTCIVRRNVKVCAFGTTGEKGEYSADEAVTSKGAQQDAEQD